MKPLRSVLLFAVTAMAQPALAQVKDESLIPDEIKNYIAYGAIMLILVLLVLAMFMLLHTFKVLTKALIPADEAVKEQAAITEATMPRKAKPTLTEKLLSLKPLSEEKDLLIEHDYDGIQELDNLTPAWFMGLFYITIVFAVGYFMVYHVLNIGQNQDQEYVTEVKIAEKAKEAYLAKSANRVDETNVEVSTDPAVLDAGQALFTTNCSPCHGDKGQGTVGPNLTDDYWLHGGNIKAIFKTIKYGVQAKGMPTWEKQLSPKQIADVASYIKSLHGTNPPNGKEPQGEKEEAEGAAAKTAVIVN